MTIKRQQTNPPYCYENSSFPTFIARNGNTRAYRLHDPFCFPLYDVTMIDKYPEDNETFANIVMFSAKPGKLTRIFLIDSMGLTTPALSERNSDSRLARLMKAAYGFPLMKEYIKVFEQNMDLNQLLFGYTA